MNFKGKVAIVTGGVQGLGKGISTALLNHGMKVLACDINENAGKLFLEEVKETLKPNIIFQKCDVSSYDELKAVFEKAKSTFGRIDVVCNNAGLVNEKNWKRMIEVNLIGVINGIHLAFEYMGLDNGGSGGAVINTASNAGLIGFDLCPIYSATKHGVVGLTRSYGQQYHFNKTGVTVSAVCPGPIETALFRTCYKNSIDEEGCKELASKLTAASVDDVVQSILQLLTSGKNGELLEVNNQPISTQDFN